MPCTGSPRSSIDAGEPEPAEQRERAGVDGVAAELVAWKRGAIDQADAGAGAREHRRGHGARGSGADDEDVNSHWHLVIWSSGYLVIWWLFALIQYK